MGTKERRERERRELRKKILDAARELFVEQGYDAVTMRKIAQAIEYSPTAIYLHFKDKMAVMRALCDAGLPGARQALPQDRRRRRPDRAPSPDRPRLRRVRPQAPQPLPADVHDSAPAQPPGRQRSRARQSRAGRLRLPQGHSGRGDRRRPLPRASSPIPSSWRRSIWAGVHGVVSLRIAKCNDAWVDWRPASASRSRPWSTRWYAACCARKA